jgi:hypothetical protein
MSCSFRFNVVAGPKRKVVGTIKVKLGMPTSAGIVQHIADKTIFFVGRDGKVTARRNFAGITVRYSTARDKYGYPSSPVGTRYTSPSRSIAA